LWQPEATRQFQYHGVQRWSGVWDNPNLYGLLMAVGVVLSGGLLIQISTSNIRWRKMLCAILCLLAAMVMGYGLFRSYSRGAWLGAICGLAYLVARSNIVEPARLSYSSCLSWLNRNRLPLSAIMLSLVVLLFWQCRFSEWPPAQRVYSIANTADFSWRNRVAAWEGATRMMIDRPLAGFGWGQAETDYNKKYLPSKLEEGAAIEMNDYLMLGISAGAPALICFVVYLALSFRRKPAGSNPSLNVHHPPFSIFTACRAGAIVLLVGFWFDGGLFKLSVGPIFWMLMELSRLGSPAREEMASLTSKSETLKLETGNHPESPHVICYSKKEIWLRRGAWVLAAAAVFQTIVYLGTPFLPVSHGTLAVARKSLISPKTTADFDFLATNSVWGGKKLKVLLEHVGLASYNRALLNWQLDDNMYRDFVLSPVITGKPDEQLNWRRSLWEEFYPRIRRQSSPADAANVVLRHLRERVTISTIENVPHDVPDIWARRITDAAGFDIVYIAALRSVGIAARLNDRGQVELFTDGKWQPALGLNAGDLPKADKK
jgi:O-antigen ligase